MTLLKQAMAILGTALTIAIIVAIVSPKTAQAVAAALVQIQPGTTTHMGQNETQLVSLYCEFGQSGCLSIDAQGNFSAGVYTVPAGYTLIVTDWQFNYIGGEAQPGAGSVDYLSSLQNARAFATAYTVGDVNGNLAANIRFETGIRFGSGLTPTDYYTRLNLGTATMQGYLVPN